MSWLAESDHPTARWVREYRARLAEIEAAKSASRAQRSAELDSGTKAMSRHGDGRLRLMRVRGSEAGEGRPEYRPAPRPQARPQQHARPPRPASGWRFSARAVRRPA